MLLLLCYLLSGEVVFSDVQYTEQYFPAGLFSLISFVALNKNK